MNHELLTILVIAESLFLFAMRGKKGSSAFRNDIYGFSLLKPAC
jgi:hypothetical protein